jgi:hypothetical protein
LLCARDFFAVSYSQFDFVYFALRTKFFAVFLDLRLIAGRLTY